MARQYVYIVWLVSPGYAHGGHPYCVCATEAKAEHAKSYCYEHWDREKFGDPSYENIRIVRAPFSY